MSEHDDVWRLYELPFASDLAATDKESRQYIRLALRCIALFDAFPYGDKDDIGTRGLEMLREMCAAGAPLREFFLEALRFLVSAYSRIKPWLGRQENVALSETVKKVTDKAIWVLDNPTSQPDAAALQTQARSNQREFLSDVKLGLHHFEPGFQNLLLKALAHRPEILLAVGR